MSINNEKFVCAIDIGGSHVTSALVRNHQVLLDTKCELTLDTKADATTIYLGWAKCINQSIKYSNNTNLIGFSFAMPNPFNYQEGIALFNGSNAKYLALNNRKIIDDLLPLLNIDQALPFRFINDASGYAMGEAHFGAALGYQKSIIITLGTGFGSGFINDGLPFTDMPYVPQGGMLWDYPYEGTIAEDYISTRWFENTFENKYKIRPKGVKEIAEKVISGEIDDLIFKEFSNHLSMILYPWIQKFGAEALVIGGNISKAFSLFEKHLKKGFENQNLGILIKPSKLGEDSALLGSSLLFSDSIWERMKDKLPKQ